MTKYSDEFKARALEMLIAEGYDPTCKSLHVNKHTLYRWKREAGITLVRHRGFATDSPTEESGEAPMPNTEATFVVPSEWIEDSDTADEPPSDAPFVQNFDAVDDDLRILAAANEELRKRNAQLRSALLSLLEH